MKLSKWRKRRKNSFWIYYSSRFITLWNFRSEEKIYVYVFVLKNVFGNIKFVKMGAAKTGIVQRKITTEMSNHLFIFSSLVLIVIKTVYLEIIGEYVYVWINKVWMCSYSISFMSLECWRLNGSKLLFSVLCCKKVFAEVSFKHQLDVVSTFDPYKWLEMQNNNLDFWAKVCELWHTRNLNNVNISLPIKQDAKLSPTKNSLRMKNA